MENIYRIGNKNILIRSVYPNVHRLCREYLTTGPADFCVETDEGDIALEFQKSEEKNIRDGIVRPPKREGYLEELAVYRKIAEKMLDYDMFLFHGSVVSVDGEGYIFTAVSGTGKSTHTELWRQLLGDRAVMINDDKPLIEIKDGKAIAYGTPYDGKHRLSTNISVPVKAICVLERAEENTIEEIGPGDAFPILYQQAYNTQESKGIAKTLSLLDQLLKCCRFYRLHCNMDIEAAEIAYNKMKG